LSELIITTNNSFDWTL